MSSTIYHSILEFIHQPNVSPKSTLEKAIKTLKQGQINGKRILEVIETGVDKGKKIPYFGYQQYAPKKGKKPLRHGVWQFWGVVLIVDGVWDRDVYGIYELSKDCRIDVHGAVAMDYDKRRFELKRIG